MAVVLTMYIPCALLVQVMYDTSLHKLLDSYLRYGPRPNEATPPVSLRGREVLASLHRRVFMTFLRMSTHKESSVSGGLQREGLYSTEIHALQIYSVFDLHITYMYAQPLWSSVASIYCRITSCWRTHLVTSSMTTSCLTSRDSWISALSTTPATSRFLQRLSTTYSRGSRGIRMT